MIEYGFIADGGPIVTGVFGIPFDSVEAARHTGEKSYFGTLQIVKRVDGDEWVLVEEE